MTASKMKVMPRNQFGFNTVYLIVFVMIIIAVGGGAYYLGFTKAPASPALTSAPTSVPTSQPTTKPSSTPTPTASASATPAATPTAAMLENIKASIVSKNTAALEGYMVNPISVIIEATECCGNLTPVAAINEIDYILEATPPWNFADNNPIAAQLRAKNPTAFPAGIIIGTSSDRKLITFTLNPEKTKITKVYMAADYKLHGI